MNNELLINDIKSNNSEFKSNNEEKQIIEEMAKILCGMKNGCDGCMFSKLTCSERKDAEAIYNANFRKQEWISVDERLPEENGRYLTCIKVSHQLFENLTTMAIIEYGKDHGFYLYSIAESVTHWMPRPEAPKMKGGAE